MGATCGSRGGAGRQRGDPCPARPRLSAGSPRRSRIRDPVSGPGRSRGPRGGVCAAQRIPDQFRRRRGGILVPGRGHPVPVRPGPCPRAAAVDVRTGLVHSQYHHGSRRSGCRCPSGDRIRPAAQDPARITSGCKGPAPRGFNDLTLTPFLARVRHLGAVRWRADPRARRPGHIPTHPFPVLLRSTSGPFRGARSHARV